ncbi:MAG: recombination mediator RecR [Caldisericia bacterium]|nr:recombination mediator RecR [Caldisericia bacterium]
MAYYTPGYQRAIEELSKLPGIGPKSAEKLADHILHLKPDYFDQFMDVLESMRKNVHPCKRCFNLTEGSFCSICSDPSRDPHTICVVEKAKDVLAIEKTSSFKGMYHVLEGSINPLNGIGPEKVRIKELFERIHQEPIQEIILALNFSQAGDLTCMYIIHQLKQASIKITRLASGIPTGTDIEFADSKTLQAAFKGREKYEMEDL